MLFFFGLPLVNYLENEFDMTIVLLEMQSSGRIVFQDASTNKESIERVGNWSK